MNKVITDEQLDGMIISAVASMGALPPDEKFSLLVNALRELRDYRKTTASAVPDGWKLVPMVPTEAMMLNESGCQHHAWDDANCPMRESRRIIWKHMIEAAPEVE